MISVYQKINDWVKGGVHVISLVCLVRPAGIIRRVLPRLFFLGRRNPDLSLHTSFLGLPYNG